MLVTLFPVQQIRSNFNQVAISKEDVLRYHKISVTELRARLMGLRRSEEAVMLALQPEFPTPHRILRLVPDYLEDASE